MSKITDVAIQANSRNNLSAEGKFVRLTNLKCESQSELTADFCAN